MTTVELKEYIRQHPNMSDKAVGESCGYSIDAVRWHRQQLGIWRGEAQLGIDETGNRYGKLTVLCKDPAPHSNGTHWVCKCDCGNVKIVRGADLRSTKPIRSCGCSNIILWDNGVWKRIDKTHIQCCKCGKIKPKGKKTRTYMCKCSVCEKQEKEQTKGRKKCIYCGRLVEEPHKRVCSECRPKSDAKKQEKKREYRRRRGTLSERRRYKCAKQNGKIDWSISLEKLMERDGNICALCGEPVDVNAYHMTDEGTFIVHMKYPSIDHILPLSKGGTHTWDNIQLAHFICNSLKSDTVEVEGT